MNSRANSGSQLQLGSQRIHKFSLTQLGTPEKIRDYVPEPSLVTKSDGKPTETTIFGRILGVTGNQFAAGESLSGGQ